MDEVFKKIEYPFGEDDKNEYYEFYCPGCKYTHHVRVTGPDAWQWNKDTVKPTINPSLMVNKHIPKLLCHSFIREGRIQFLGDCWHELKNQTVPLPPWSFYESL